MKSQPKTAINEAETTNSFRDEERDLIDNFLQTQEEAGLSANTAAAYRSDLYAFAKWLNVVGVHLAEVSQKVVRAFVQKRESDGLKPASIARQLTSVRMLYRHLKNKRVVLSDPTRGVAGPKVKAVRRDHLTEDEVIRLINAPGKSEIGIRDSLMIRMMYSCGLKVSELANLQLQDVNTDEAILSVPNQHGGKRKVPLSETLCRFIRNFVGWERSDILKEKESDCLFPTYRGGKMTRQAVWHMVKKHAKSTGIDKPVSANSLRYAYIANQKRKNVRLKDLMRRLGHTDLATTQAAYNRVPAFSERDQSSRHHPIVYT